MKKKQLIALWSNLSKRRHRQVWFTLVLMFLASLAEIITIGAVIPFLGMLTSPEQIYNHDLIKPFNEAFNINSSKQLLFPLTVAFMLAAFLAGVIRLSLLFVMTRLSWSTGADLSVNIYHRTLYQEYSIHIARNSSEIINSIITKTGAVISGVINPILILVSSIIIILAIIVTLFFIDPEIAISASLVFGILYSGVILYTKKHLEENSKKIADKSTVMVKSLQEGLGGIRDVLIGNSQKYYYDLYRNANISLLRASGDNQIISGSPRFVMEMLGMIVIAGIAYSISLRGNGLSNAIPILGALALGAQRLLPAIQQAYTSYTAIKGSYASFQDVLILLEQPLPKYVLENNKNGYKAPIPISFESSIGLKNLSFRYSVNNTKESPWILKNINLKFTKGQRIGFIGETGSGKSTLLDILMGLLPPTNGQILVDGVSVTTENILEWQLHIAHVPQHIFLSDNSIAENIAFGVPKEKIDYERIKIAAEKAQISKLIEEWDNGYQSIVGERGAKLSGGQRQRIGIARALYREADVLIFDEATSALDSNTENEVMNSIECLGRDLTIFIIAHRLSTLKGCDQLVEIDKSTIVNVGNYESIIKKTKKYLISDPEKQDKK